MPFQNVPSYEQPPLELTQGFQSQPQGVAPAPYLPYTESLPYPMEQDVESPTVNAEASGSNEHGGRGFVGEVVCGITIAGVALLAKLLAKLSALVASI